jgi:hypothetical protein
MIFVLAALIVLFAIGGFTYLWEHDFGESYCSRCPDREGCIDGLTPCTKYDKR